MKSLRLRLALISTAISGIVIIGFGLAGWMLTARILRESIDLRLSVPLDRIVRDLHPRTDRDRVIENLEIGMGDDVAEGERLILLLDRDGSTFYQAPDTKWVSNIPATFLESKLPRGENRPPQFGGDGPKGPPKGGAERSPGFGRNGPGPAPKGRGPEAELAELLGLDPPEDRERRGPPPGSGSGPPRTEHFTLEIDGARWRAGFIEDRGYRVLMATNLSGFEAEIRQVRQLFFLALPLCLLAIGIGGWFVAHRAMRPVDLITQTASQITAQGLDQRIPREAHGYKELSDLVDVLNGMMDRLGKSFQHAMRFSADASHELKTPLAVMQAELQTALKDCPPGSKEEESLISVSHEAERLKRIIRGLMLLAQADSGQLAIRKEDFSLSDEIKAICEDAEILCEKEGLQFNADIGSDLSLNADPVLLRQAFQNLVSNAVKYNQPGGTVNCWLYRDEDAGEIIFVIANTGPGIPKEEQEKIFERFYRVDRSRSRDVDGFGLGLNLAWEIVQAMGGELRLTEASEAMTRFEIGLKA